ncbi:transcriptional regulator [Subtercola boreus]|uniref:Transcriptional regulator n=1 Tax=Subtercola boreus TaxID=120213 RepID=A0A3E0VB09_9MICO|nr:GAF and ANTAR domain-containing protein [Subtercola boreus]RFA06713.1 transcriptional regulator [Subtercola boreus]
MDGTTREARISAAFVKVADTLTKDFDVVDLLHTLVEECVEILGIDAGGLMLADANGQLQLMTSTSESADLVEIMQLAADAGPCIDCFATGVAVNVPDIQHDGGQWPAFQKAAIQQGFNSVHATPMKLRGHIIGTMNLFGKKSAEVSARDADLAQALTDVATIGILQERLIREGQMIAEQLHSALDTRIIIEQAKGFVAHSLSIEMPDAFFALRSYARNHNFTIRSVAEQISNQTLTVDELTLNPLSKDSAPARPRSE